MCHLYDSFSFLYMIINITDLSKFFSCSVDIYHTDGVTLNCRSTHFDIDQGGDDENVIYSIENNYSSDKLILYLYFKSLLAFDCI